MRNSQALQRAGGLPQALLADRPLEAVLDEIVGAVGIAREGARIAAEGRHAFLDLVQELLQARSCVGRQC